MKTLTLHLFDVLENSAKAGASQVCLAFAARQSTLHIRLEDDGPGFPAHLVANPADPYATTRRERPVGLGLALLRQSAEESGGRFCADNAPGGGARIEMSLHMSHWDARPLGDPAGLILETAAAWPSLLLTVSLAVEEADSQIVFDGAEVVRALDGLAISHPDVRRALKADLEDAFAPLLRWIDRLQPNLGASLPEKG